MGLGGHYHFGATTELISQLNQKKGVLEGKSKTVKERVGAELQKIEEKRRLEEAEKIRLSEEARAQEKSFSSENISIPPPPPPPPGEGSSAKPSKKETVSAEKRQETTVSPPSSEGKSNLNMDEIRQKAKESQERQEAQAIRNHLINKLIDLVVKVGNKDIEDIEDDFDPDEKQLLDLIGEDGFKGLKKHLKEGTEKLSSNKEGPKDSISPQQLLQQRLMQRRGAVAGEKSFLSQIKDNRNKDEIKGAVSDFIKQSGKETSLLEASKDIKQRAEAEAKRLEEERTIEEARQKEERAKREAEEKRIAEEKRALEVKEKLAVMGVKEGIVNTNGVKEAESEKDQVVGEVFSKKSSLQKTDDFLSSIDKELSEEINALQEAESLRVATLETTASTKQEEVIKPNSVEEAIKKDVIQEEVQQIPIEEAIKENVEQEEVLQIPVEEAIVVQEEVQQTVMAEPPKEASQEDVMRGRRKDALNAIGFDKCLESIAKKANSLEQHGFHKAANEAKTIHQKLINYREEFIQGKMDTDNFKRECKEAIDSKNTKELSKSRGMLGAIVRAVQTVVDAIKGHAYSETKKTAMERIKDMRESLDKMRESTKEEPGKTVDERPSQTIGG
ncbi:hypothetical protein [Legionella norrlandica]|uniref:hypothetical protein n=1 Tax=Legionella norrlandica TaxID=1498499 RepID=UPI000AF94D39|nr:hypothetical protein [Legionella norrlandica]